MPITRAQAEHVLRQACQEAGETWTGIPPELESTFDSVCLLIDNVDELQDNVAAFVAMAGPLLKPT